MTALRLENLLHGLAEYFCDLECQWKAGIVFLGFDGVDRLA
jgi:hypothetical protein